MPSALLGASSVGADELEALCKVVENRNLFRHYGLGKSHFADDFEALLRSYFEVPYALGLTSCSAALQCAWAALGIGPGDEVVLPAFSWFSCYNSIVLAGATPVFCEIDRSMNLDADHLREKLNSKTKAVLVVHYQGSAANLEAIKGLLDPGGIALVEDVAQAMGGSLNGRKLGTVGDIGVFSMQGNKILSTGEGGFLLCKDARIFERAVRFHDLGILREVFAAQLPSELGIVADSSGGFSGLQFRISEVTAAMGIAQFAKLDGMISKCRKWWHRLRSNLEQRLPGISFRQSYDLAGDLGITMFIDFGSGEKARLFSQAYNAEGLRVGPSSGMVNLLHLDYVKQRRMPHPAMPPFAKGQPGEAVRYSPADCPETDGILSAMVAIAVGPLYSEADFIDIENGIVKACSGLGLFEG
ncbi:MAG: aminotransferase class I/II-fold pyridoxal phosphate-dependent enzyme [Opitutales bacterium]|nr:aminotransferase class I/II-fold pyridoxal phosphate-dependent enzyme [Opitutales bacterium]